MPGARARARASGRLLRTRSPYRNLYRLARPIRNPRQHNGHNQPCADNVTTDDDSTVDWLNQLGFDVMSFNMQVQAQQFTRFTRARVR